MNVVSLFWNTYLSTVANRSVRYSVINEVLSDCSKNNETWREIIFLETRDTMRSVVFFLYAIVIFVSCFIIVSLNRLPNDFGKVALPVGFVDYSDSATQKASFPETKTLRRDSPSAPFLGDQTEQIPRIPKSEEAKIIPPAFTQVKEEKKVVPTQKVQKSIPVVRNGEKDSYVINPRSLLHKVIHYEPFVIPPPIRTRSMKFSPLQDFSEYYKFLKAASNRCDLDICKRPLKYLNQFSSWDCRKFPSLCSDPSAFLIMQEPKYLEGRVDIIENGVVSHNLDCGWPADHMKSENQFDSRLVGHFQGPLVPMVVPEGLSFQHFVDGVLPKLVILVDILRKEPSYTMAMDMRIVKGMPKQLLERMGLLSGTITSWDSLPWKNGQLYADKLIMGCKVPPLHPELWQKAQDLFDLPWKKEGWKQKRHIMLYLSRKQGTSNPGRDVVNENALLKELEQWASEKGFELVVFTASDYKTLDDLFMLLADVDVVLGPHGGAFYNMLFMRRGITVIEFVPDSRMFLSTAQAVHLIIYLQASLLGNNYFNIRAADKGHSNMYITPSLVLEILNSAF